MIKIVSGGSLKSEKGLELCALEMIKSAKNIVFQTKEQYATKYSDNFTSLDEFYEKSENFEEFIDKAINYLLSFDQEVIFVSCGPVIYSELISRLCKSTKDVEIFGGQTALNRALVSGFDVGQSLKSVNPYNDFDIDTNAPLHIFNIDSEFLLFDIKAKLLDYYKPDTLVVVNDELMALENLDYKGIVSIVLPRVPLLEKTKYSYEDLVTIVKELRQKCPWDKVQTHKSIRFNLVEECLEMFEAIDNEDSINLVEEMGDVLLQVVFHGVMEREHQDMDMVDITSEICKKLIRRHPHVYGEAKADTGEKVLKNWDEIKRKEYGYNSKLEELKHICEYLPGVMRAYKTLKKADKLGVGLKGELIDVMPQIMEKIQNGQDKEENCKRFMLFAVDYIRKNSMEPYMLLHEATEDFVKKLDEIQENGSGKVEI